MTEPTTERGNVFFGPLTIPVGAKYYTTDGKSIYSRNLRSHLDSRGLVYVDDPEKADWIFDPSVESFGDREVRVANVIHSPEDIRIPINSVIYVPQPDNIVATVGPVKYDYRPMPYKIYEESIKKGGAGRKKITDGEKTEFDLRVKGGRYGTGINELDNIFSGGFRPGEVTIIRVDPGAEQLVRPIIKLTAGSFAARSMMDPKYLNPSDKENRPFAPVVYTTMPGNGWDFVKHRFEDILPSEAVEKGFLPVNCEINKDNSENRLSIGALGTGIEENKTILDGILDEMKKREVPKNAIIPFIGSADFFEYEINHHTVAELRKIVSCVHRDKHVAVLTVMGEINPELAIKLKGMTPDRYYRMGKIGKTGVVGMIDEFDPLMPVYAIQYRKDLNYPVPMGLPTRL